jgi:hypothetical protein
MKTSEFLNLDSASNSSLDSSLEKLESAGLSHKVGKTLTFPKVFPNEEFKVVSAEMHTVNGISGIKGNLTINYQLYGIESGTRASKGGQFKYLVLLGKNKNLVLVGRKKHFFGKTAAGALQSMLESLVRNNQI